MTQTKTHIKRSREYLDVVLYDYLDYAKKLGRKDFHQQHIHILEIMIGHARNLQKETNNRPELQELIIQLENAKESIIHDD